MATTKTLDPKDNMLDLFEILRARPTTPGKNDDFLRFVKGREKFRKLRCGSYFNPNLFQRYEFDALILRTVFVVLSGSL